MQMKVKSKSSKTKPDKGCTTPSPILGVQLELPLFVTVESLKPNKKTTSKDKLNSCKNNTQKPKSSKISEVDSTSNGRVLKPYWTDYCAVISSKLLLPVGTDLPDLDSSLYNIWSNKMVVKSWFSTKLYTVQNQKWSPMFSLSSTSFPVEFTDSENTVKKSKKIRIYLSLEQKQLLKQWIGVARFTYNRTVKYLQQPETKANWKAIKSEILNNLPEWAKAVPYQIKSIAVRDACIAVREAKVKLTKTGQVQQVKFKSRKNPIQSCYIPKSAVSAKGIYQTKLGKIKFAESTPETFGDCRLVVHRGQYHLCLPVDTPKHQTENQGLVVALDPGVRNFLTLFSENSFGWIGVRDIGKIQRLCYHLDDLISRLTKAKSKTKRRMKKAANRMRLKIRNLIDELHHKTALFLVQNFDVILLPTFEVSQMTIKSSRKLRSKSVRQMLNWAHYRFELFLKHKAAEYKKVVVDVSEAYTSKTVSWSGEILNNLGGKKVVTGNDGFRLDRDLNGSRGIFIKSVVENFSTTLGDTPSAG